MPATTIATNHATFRFDISIPRSCSSFRPLVESVANLTMPVGDSPVVDSQLTSACRSPQDTDRRSTYAVRMEQADVFRVTVRGRFCDLTERVRASLERARPEHDIFVSAFTEEGTFTYDERLQFFNLRYEVRDAADDADALAFARAEAETFLKVLGIGHRLGRVSAMNMTEAASR